jgi:hypothetical protein
MIYQSFRSLSQIADQRLQSQTYRIADGEPNQTFFSAPEPTIFLNLCFAVIMSIPHFIDNFSLKHVEINGFLFSQEEQIRICLQHHLKRCNFVPNSLRMSPRNLFVSVFSLASTLKLRELLGCLTLSTLFGHRSC